MPVTLSEGQTKKLDANLIPVYVPPVPATLWGYMTDAETGVAISGAIVSITGPGGTYSDPSDYSGRYEITGIVPGTYSGTVIAAGYEEKAF